MMPAYAIYCRIQLFRGFMQQSQQHCTVVPSVKCYRIAEKLSCRQHHDSISDSRKLQKTAQDVSIDI